METATVVNENVATREIEVLLVGGNPAVRERLRLMLESEPGFSVTGEAANAAQALRGFAGTRPDVVIVNLAGSPLARTMRMLRRFAAAGARTLLVANAIEKTNIVQAQQLGVAGVLSKDPPPPVLFEAVRSVAAGFGWLGRAPIDQLAPAAAPRLADNPFGLTKREMEVIAAVVRSYLNSLN